MGSFYRRLSGPVESSVEPKDVIETLRRGGKLLKEWDSESVENKNRKHRALVQKKITDFGAQYGTMDKQNTPPQSIVDDLQRLKGILNDFEGRLVTRFCSKEDHAKANCESRLLKEEKKTWRLFDPRKVVPSMVGSKTGKIAGNDKASKSAVSLYKLEGEDLIEDIGGPPSDDSNDDGSTSDEGDEFKPVQKDTESTVGTALPSTQNRKRLVEITKIQAAKLGAIKLRSNNKHFEGGYSKVTEGVFIKVVKKGDKQQYIRVALKEYQLVKTKNAERIEQRLRRELKLSGSLSHPNVAQVIGYTLHTGAPALVLYWYENGRVLDYLTHKNPGRDLYDVCHQIAKGLAYLHDDTIKDKVAILHGDLKPDNIMVDCDEHETIKIIDFGVGVLKDEVKKNETDKVRASRATLAARWQSPEHLKTSQPSVGSDMYALGCTFMQITTFKLLERQKPGTRPISRSRKPFDYICSELRVSRSANNLAIQDGTAVDELTPVGRRPYPSGLIDFGGSGIPIDIQPLLSRLWTRLPDIRGNAQQAVGDLQKLVGRGAGAIMAQPNPDPNFADSEPESFDFTRRTCMLTTGSQYLEAQPSQSTNPV